MSEPLIFATPGEAGRMLGCTDTWVNELIRRGALPVAARTLRGGALLNLVDVERLAEARRANPPRGGRPRKIFT